MYLPFQETVSPTRTSEILIPQLDFPIGPIIPPSCLDTISFDLANSEPGYQSMELSPPLVFEGKEGKNVMLSAPYS